MSASSTATQPSTTKSSATGATAAERPLRADAQRNRDKIIETARTLFRERGSDASMDEIAKRAGVGAGTLYRHFPTRDDLVDAVLRDWSDRIDADSAEIRGQIAEATVPAREALTVWFRRFLENVGIYHGAAAKVMSALDDPASPIYRKCQVLGAANRGVLEAVGQTGALRDGVDPGAVLRMVSGIAISAENAGLEPEQTQPMLDILLDGILLPA